MYFLAAGTPAVGSPLGGETTGRLFGVARCHLRDAITYPNHDSPHPRSIMNTTSNPQDRIITALMGAVTFGQSVTIDPDGSAHYRDENTPEARAEFEREARERMSRAEADRVLEAYSDGATEGEWHLSQGTVNHIIGEAHLGGVESAVQVLRTADRIEAAWAQYGIELEVDLSHQPEGRVIGGLPLTEAIYTALIVVELWRHGYAGTLRGCAELRNTFATNIARGVDPFVAVEAQLVANEASPHIRNTRSTVPRDDFAG
jgi:hypothetical protein